MAKQKKTAPRAGNQSMQDATQTLARTLATALSRPTIELRVGVRNISDNTIGVVSPFPGREQDLDLHADIGLEHNPGSGAVISYAWWQRMRKSALMERGEIIRDDSLLGQDFTPGPEDMPSDIPANWQVNAIVNPEEWVLSFKNDAELRVALEKITADGSLRRIRRVVDMKLKALEKSFGTDPQRAKKALEGLPATYQMLDNVITLKLERPGLD